MNIMFEDSINDDVKCKYTLLELDTFYFSDIDKNKTAYCLIESLPIQEMLTIDKLVDLHKNLIKNYRLQNWKFCEDSLEHLLGKWNGELDSFYLDYIDRINLYKKTGTEADWTGIIVHS